MPTEEPTPTEFEFELPRGIRDSAGVLHRTGRMRLATAHDEIEPLADLRVRKNPAYLGILLLSSVITRVGTITDIRPETIEQLYATDLAYLQDLYERINASDGLPTIEAGSDRLGEPEPLA
ncbi:hypothetical protein ACFWCB_10260 [Streptomyces sp. NPDC060048]|uniref:hypothetical protein n=1 Tax=unclassified Streptomyces TaxID=2593676 RepID=UPI0036AA3192